MENTDLFSRAFYQFGSVCSYGRSPDLNPETLFAASDWYEEYNPLQEYARGEFEHDYGRGKLRYRLECYVVDQTYYVVAEEFFSSEELESLSAFCSCCVCDSAWYDPRKYVACGHCFGCLKEGRSDRDVVYTARERKRIGFTRSTSVVAPLLCVMAAAAVLLAFVLC